MNPPYDNSWLDWQSWSLHSPCLHGQGISESSARNVLETALEFHFHGEDPLADPAALAASALERERAICRHPSIAANDIYPIVHGGVTYTMTEPHRRAPKGGHPIPGAVKSVPLTGADRQWISDHMLLAFNFEGKRHEASGLLVALASHRKRRGFVRRFSSLAASAGQALLDKDATGLAGYIGEYRKLFNDWTRGVYTRGVAALAKKMGRQFGGNLLGWKPPGAGAAEAIFLLVSDAGLHEPIRAWLAGQPGQWRCFPVTVADGIQCEKQGANAVSFSAPHRIDLIGAADLGQDLSISEPGRCLAIAIEPSSRLGFSGGISTGKSRLPGGKPGGGGRPGVFI